MSRRGKIVVSVLALVVLVGAGWFVVAWVRNAFASTTSVAAEPECVVRQFPDAAVDFAPSAALPTVALADTPVTGAAGSSPAPLAGSMSLAAVQLQHASTINAVGLQRGLSEQARIIALATALQESSLRNLTSGDLDSVGLFQQRPSQGWGTVAEITDPIYASNAFYDALVEVPNWPSLSLTEAAQAVQYSAFPDAYAKWEPAATLLADALSAPPYPRVSCRAGATPPTTDAPARPELAGSEAGSAGLRELLADAEAELGGLTVFGVSADGRTATVSVSAEFAEGNGAAAVAFWAVAHAAGLNVTAVDVSTFRWADHAWAAAAAVADEQVGITVGG